MFYQWLLVRILRAGAMMGEMHRVGTIAFGPTESIAVSIILDLSTLIMYIPSASFGKEKKKGIEML